MERNGIIEYQRCRICLEKKCKTPGSCNCKECKKISECPRLLRATIRITNKCTQKCRHCCFSSSPKSSLMMTPEMARKISQFLKVNHVFTINVMGGEFFCNPWWPDILDSLSSAVLSVRLVSNSDWATSEETTRELGEFLKTHPGIHMSLSKDQWHTNKNVLKAAEFLESLGVAYNIATPEETTEASIVPVGRGEICGGLYSMFGNYCAAPEHQYSFLIDEEGDIYKCEFGSWKYDSVLNYLDGGFEDRFKEFNSKFYGVFIPSCLRCRRASESVEGKTVKTI